MVRYHIFLPLISRLKVIDVRCLFPWVPLIQDTVIFHIVSVMADAFWIVVEVLREEWSGRHDLGVGLVQHDGGLAHVLDVASRVESGPDHHRLIAQLNPIETVIALGKPQCLLVKPANPLGVRDNALGNVGRHVDADEVLAQDDVEASNPDS